MVSCKSSEKFNSSFKKEIREKYPDKSVCFRIDKSKRVGDFGLNLFKITGLKRDLKYSLQPSFESGENCDLVALTDKMNISIILAVIYPYKSDIEQSLTEYPNWYYKGKVYLKNNATLDTITVEHNPPIINPWLKPEEMKNRN